MQTIKMVLFLIVFMLFSTTTIAKQTEFNLSEYYVYGKEAYILASKIDTLKEKYYLEYKDLNDLQDTCKKIIHYSSYTNFDKYDVAAIVSKEGKFNPNALNKSDGGKGLMQLTKIREYHKDTLYWLPKNKLYNKDYNIIGGLIVLEDNLNRYKTKQQAIKRYNGSTKKSTRYMQDVYRLKQEIKSVKI